MQPLTHSERRAIVEIAAELHSGDALTADRLAELVAEWEPRIAPGKSEVEERFAVARPDGTTTGLVGPRWVFHLFGLRHRAVHVGLATPGGLVILQRRSPVLRDWPGAPDMAVAGHVPQADDGSDLTFLYAAWKEMEEEIGLAEQDAEATLVEKQLVPVGIPYVSVDRDLKRDTPFLNVETRQIYAATLTGEGLARLHFADAEVGGLMLVTLETAWDILLENPLASGLRYSLPRYLDWLAQR